MTTPRAISRSQPTFWWRVEWLNIEPRPKMMACSVLVFGLCLERVVTGQLLGRLESVWMLRNVERKWIEEGVYGNFGLENESKKLIEGSDILADIWSQVSSVKGLGWLIWLTLLGFCCDYLRMTSSLSIPLAHCWVNLLCVVVQWRFWWPCGVWEWEDENWTCFYDCVTRDWQVCEDASACGLMLAFVFTVHMASGWRGSLLKTWKDDEKKESSKRFSLSRRHVRTPVSRKALARGRNSIRVAGDICKSIL